jgi:bifunctional non-homologous end joining protein LigD
MKKVTEIEGKSIALSNLEKDLYPAYGFTKAHVLEYYRRISPFILPHLRDRALTLKRYPGGVREPFFFEKRCPSYRPSWVKTAEIPQHNGERITVCLVNDLNTLIWVANLASLELHVPLARTDSPDAPDAMVFDLDPGDGAGLRDCIHVALILRDLLAGLKLKSFAKTSGQKGLHVYVPLDRKGVTFADSKQFSKTVAELMQREYPDLVTAKVAKVHRTGKVLINWAQNDHSKTTVSVYSLRAREKPYVSFPLAWKELVKPVIKHQPEKLLVLPEEALTRAEKEGDLFREMIAGKQKLPYL